MTNGIVIVDFAGTLVRASAIEEANHVRLLMLGMKLPSAEEEQKQHATKSHYEEIRSRIETVYGIRDDMTFDFVQSKGHIIPLSGKRDANDDPN